MGYIYQITPEKLTNFPKQCEQGFVLVTVLLLLAVITMVVMRMAENSLLESKMSNYWAQRTIAMYQAEIDLTKAENGILHDKNRDKYRLIQHKCGVDFYLAEGRAMYYDTTIELQSTIAIVDHSAQCQPPPKEITGRQAWSYVESW